jgi:transcriptional regulator with XRE-family HTH domain
VTGVNGSPRARALAAALRQVRESRKVKLRELADKLDMDPSYLSRLETGKKIANERTTASILGALGVPSDERERITNLAQNASEPNWLIVGMPGVPQQLACVVESERAASSIVQWSPMIIPGLLQTDDYVRAIAETAGLPNHEIESRVMVRSNRRKILTNATPAKYEVFIDEIALTKPIGSPKVMIEQLHYLITMSKCQNVTLRVVPWRVPWHPGVSGAFVRYEFPDSPPVMHFENHSSSSFVSESDDVENYREVVGMISSYALTPADSQQFIAQVIADEWSKDCD